MQSNSNRISYIDISKGIGIILVCIGHFDISNEDSVFFNLFTWIYSFHMPFFFFISGLLFDSKSMTTKDFLKRKLINLIVPYLLFSIYNWILLEIFQIEHPQFLIHGWGRNPLWFIPIIFIIELLHFFIIKDSNLKKIISVSLLFIIFLWKTHTNGWLPYAVSELPWFYFCFLSGYISRPYIKRYRENQGSKSLPFVLFSFHALLLYVVILPYNPNYRLQDNDLISYMLRYLIGVIGTLALITFSIQIEHRPAIHLKWIGRNTMVILCVHWLYFRILQKINNQNIEFGGVNSVLVFFLCYISILIYNRYVNPMLVKLRKQ